VRPAPIALLPVTLAAGSETFLIVARHFSSFSRSILRRVRRNLCPETQHGHPVSGRKWDTRGGRRDPSHLNDLRLSAAVDPRIFKPFQPPDFSVQQQLLAVSEIL